MAVPAHSGIVTPWHSSLNRNCYLTAYGECNREEPQVSMRYFIQQLHRVLAGVGNRGSSAVSRLVQNGKLGGAELWCLDHDRKLLETVGSANTVVVRKEEPHMVRTLSQKHSCWVWDTLCALISIWLQN